MAEAQAVKWKKNNSLIRLPPDEDSLCCLRDNYLAYLVRHPSLKHHSMPIGHGWELVDGHCRPVRYTRPALPTHLPASRPVEDSTEDEGEYDWDEKENDDVQ